MAVHSVSRQRAPRSTYSQSSSHLSSRSSSLLSTPPSTSSSTSSHTPTTTTTATDMPPSTGIIPGSTFRKPRGHLLPVSCNDAPNNKSQPFMPPTEDDPLIRRRPWGLRHPQIKKFTNFSSLVILAFMAFLVLSTTRLFSHGHRDHLATIGVPLSCHSHNDYWRRRPLYDALEAGCIGVEADVWRRNNDLYVSHHSPSTASAPTFSHLYVQPLVNILERRNFVRAKSPAMPPHGVFPRFPNQTLVLMIDFKEKDLAAFDMMRAQLQPLRERGWLSFYSNGTVTYRPITVVLTGDATLDWVLRNTTYRDFFLDAPALDLHKDVEHRYNWTNSFYASAKFGSAFGMLSGYLGTPSGIDNYVEMAHERGLEMRFWSQPAWPVAMRNRLWGDLLDAGVDYLNVDDLVGVNRWFAERNGMGQSMALIEEIPMSLD